MRVRRGVSVLVPAFDEADTIAGVLERLAGLPLDAEVIVVDDGSRDATPAILTRFAESPNVVVVRQEHRGKGAAVRTALERASAGICVIHDADGEYDAADLARLIEPVASGRADVVYGSRLAPGSDRRAFARRQLLGNQVISLVARLLYGSDLTDVETGHKAFRTGALRGLPLSEDGFGIETEITAWVCRAGLRVEEVPISYHPRGYADGKKITWRDGVRAIYVLIVCRFRRAGRSPRAPSALAKGSEST